MRFKVTGLTNIVCCGCGGITNVAPNRVYKVEDLTCNCESSEEPMKFKVTHISDITYIDNNDSTRVVPDSVYMFDEDYQIQELQNAGITMFDEPYIQYTKTTLIEIVGQDVDGNVLVQNVDDDSDRWIIPSDVFNETYESVEKIDYDVGGPIDAAPVDEVKVEGTKTQTVMFKEDPENIINPKDTNMTEPEVREYLKSLGWQELLEAAKNNEVVKQPSTKREELEEMIIQKVFHE